MTASAPAETPSFLPFPPAVDRPLRLGVLISGGGTTLLNFVAQIADGTLPVEIPVVIASQKNCKGVERAQAAGLRVEVIRPKDYASVEAFSTAVFDVLREAKIELVTLAGFLSLLRIPDDYLWRVLNIHPSLIPAFCGHGFYGHHVHEAAVSRGVKVSGCTVHFADNEYDHGPIVLQRTVSVPDGCTADELASLVFEQEKLAYPEAIRLLASGALTINGRRTVIRPC
ncbi:MAG: phosphoribosylglycinamide formyltransferase [Planctomycetaceae bacterium]|nr:phosphoribosylglycinamide formyltransferase [Planctomycetaceae bacterium]